MAINIEKYFSTLDAPETFGLREFGFNGSGIFRPATATGSIDHFGFDGDFIESQTFGYLAVRTYLNLPISFPNTTGCKKPITGGIMAKNY